MRNLGQSAHAVAPFAAEHVIGFRRAGDHRELLDGQRCPPPLGVVSPGAEVTLTPAGFAGCQNLHFARMLGADRAARDQSDLIELFQAPLSVSLSGLGRGPEAEEAFFGSDPKLRYGPQDA